MGQVIILYDILINGHLVNGCMETGERVLTDAKCTIDLQTLANDHFMTTPGDVVLAKVRASYLEGGDSDWSEVGGSALIPI